MAQSMAIGQAPGIAAAPAADGNGTVRSVPFDQVRARLVTDGALVDMEQVA